MLFPEAPLFPRGVYQCPRVRFLVAPPCATVDPAKPCSIYKGEKDTLILLGRLKIPVHLE